MWTKVNLRSTTFKCAVWCLLVGAGFAIKANHANTPALSEIKIEDSLKKPDYLNNIYRYIRTWSVHPRPIGKRTLVLYNQRSTHRSSDFEGDNKKQLSTSASFVKGTVNPLHFLQPAYNGEAGISDTGLQLMETGQLSQKDDETEPSDTSELQGLRHGNKWFGEAESQELMLKPNKGLSIYANSSNIDTTGINKRIWTPYRRPPSNGLNADDQVRTENQEKTRIRISDALLKLKQLGVLAW